MTNPPDTSVTEDTLRHWLAGHGVSPSDESMEDLLEIVRTECRHAEIAAISSMPSLEEAARRVLEWWPENSENGRAARNYGSGFAEDIRNLRAALSTREGLTGGEEG